MINKQTNKKKKKYHLVIGGGGFRGFYAVGVADAIYKCGIYEQIVGLSGTSAGAIVSVFIACHITKKEWTRTFYTVRDAIKNDGKTTLEALRIAVDQVLPSNAHEICNMKNVQIVATEIGLLSGIRKKVFRKFESRKHLIQCICASSCIPFVLHWKYPFVVKIEDKFYIDGCFMDNLPILKKRNYVEQIVISLMDCEYPIHHSLYPFDDNIEQMIERGSVDFMHFFMEVLANPDINRSGVSSRGGSNQNIFRLL